MNRAAIVDWAAGIYQDLDLGTVRQWLQDHPGRKATGYLPVYAPREIIHAAGMMPVGIHGSGDIEIIRGDAFYQSYSATSPARLSNWPNPGDWTCCRQSCSLRPAT